MAAFPGRELLHRTEVEKWLGVSRSWIYAQMRAGRFPEPLKIGKRAVRWRVSDLEEWINSRPVSHGEIGRPEGTWDASAGKCAIAEPDARRRIRVGREDRPR